MKDTGNLWFAIPGGFLPIIFFTHYKDDDGDDLDNIKISVVCVPQVFSLCFFMLRQALCFLDQQSWCLLRCL